MCASGGVAQVHGKRIGKAKPAEPICSQIYSLLCSELSGGQLLAEFDQWEVLVGNWRVSVVGRYEGIFPCLSQPLVAFLAVTLFGSLVSAR